MVKQALRWLKSEKTVREFKIENKKALPDTAWYLK